MLHLYWERSLALVQGNEDSDFMVRAVIDVNTAFLERIQEIRDDFMMRRANAMSDY